MNIYKKVLEFVGEYNPEGMDEYRAYVQEGCELFAHGKKSEAKEAFYKSGLDKSGILYFAIREFAGSEKDEIALYRFILDEI